MQRKLLLKIVAIYHILLTNKPIIIFMIIDNTVNIYFITFYLIKNNIPFFNKYFTIFVLWYIRFSEKGKMLGKLTKRTQCIHNFFLNLQPLYLLEQ